MLKFASAILTGPNPPVARSRQAALNLPQSALSSNSFALMPLHGTSRAYILRRLRSEGLDYLADAVEAGRISAHGVGLELGWFRRPNLVGRTDNQAKLRRFRFRQLLREAQANATRRQGQRHRGQRPELQ